MLKQRSKLNIFFYQVICKVNVATHHDSKQTLTQKSKRHFSWISLDETAQELRPATQDFMGITVCVPHIVKWKHLHVAILLCQHFRNLPFI